MKSGHFCGQIVRRFESGHRSAMTEVDCEKWLPD